MAKSLNIGNTAGQINLRGKLEKALRCGCCTMFDLRPKYRDIEHSKEIKEASQDTLEKQRLMGL